jgi:hypothetical protein
MFFLVLTLLTAPPEWKFVDSPMLANRSVLIYRNVELADKPTRPLHAEDVPPKGSKFGSIILGQGGRQRLAVVWHEASKTLWLDKNNNGKFEAEERHQLSEKPLELKLAIPFDADNSATRTVLIRPRNEGVAWAVRGYTQGSISIAGKPYQVAITDGNADGCFDSSVSDRVWLDLDDDGQFNALTEQFSIGHAIEVKGRPVLIRPQADGLGAIARERPNEIGSLRLKLWQQPQSKVAAFQANIISEFGELIVARSVDEMVKLPIGKYRIDGLNMTLSNAQGKLWQYRFYSDSSKPTFTIEQNQTTVHELLSKPTMTINLEDDKGATPGSSQMISATIQSGNLHLAGCDTIYNVGDYGGMNVYAEIKLTEPGSVVVDSCKTSFN